MNKICMCNYKQYSSISIISFCFNLSACSQLTIEEKRQETMIDAFHAFSKSDTTKLYDIIDTVLYFSIKGEENFDRIKNRLYSNFNSQNIKINKNDFEKIDCLPGMTTCYEISLPVQEVEFDSVQFVFEFRPEQYKKIYYLEVLWHFRSKDDSAEIDAAPPRKN